MQLEFADQNKTYGVFTYQLAKYLDPTDTYRTLESKLDASVFSFVPEQNPTFEGDSERLVLGNLKRKDIPFATSSHSKIANDFTCSVNCGFVHSATVGSEFELYELSDASMTRPVASGKITAVHLSLIHI